MVKGDLNLWAKPHFTLISTPSAVLPWMHYNCFFFPLFALSPGLAAALRWYSWGGSTICSIWNLKFCVWSSWPKSTIPVVLKWTWNVCFKKCKIRNPWGSKICMCSFSFLKHFSLNVTILNPCELWEAPGGLFSPSSQSCSSLCSSPGFALLRVSHITPLLRNSEVDVSNDPSRGMSSMLTQISTRWVEEGIAHQSCHTACFY